MRPVFRCVKGKKGDKLLHHFSSRDGWENAAFMLTSTLCCRYYHAVDPSRTGRWMLDGMLTFQPASTSPISSCRSQPPPSSSMSPLLACATWHWTLKHAWSTYANCRCELYAFVSVLTACYASVLNFVRVPSKPRLSYTKKSRL